jgi:hypothetical protein
LFKIAQPKKPIMKKILLGTALFFTGTSFIQAQGNKAVYGELGGNGLVFSANYDMRFGKTETGFGFRAGIGFAATGGLTVITFPVGLNYLTGQGPHHLEAGIGVTPVTATVSFFEDDDNETGTATFVMPTIGYRYASKGKGFVGRIYVGPVFAGGSVFFPWGGISAGIKF